MLTVLTACLCVSALVRGSLPSRPEHLSGIRRGDVWCYSPLKVIGVTASDMVPFHKLSQWLTFSLLEPIESLGVQFTQLELMTGLAEYRNGSGHRRIRIRAEKAERRTASCAWTRRTGRQLETDAQYLAFVRCSFVSAAAVCSWTWVC